jgi:hypothetical protein
MNKTPFWKQKTTWTAVAGIITAAGAYFANEIQLQTLIESAFAAAMVIFMRQGVEKSK